jgi:phage terminase small subunit
VADARKAKAAAALTKRGKAKMSTAKRASARSHVLFAEAYMANGQNATQAALKAGYSLSRPDAAGQRLLLRADVQALIAERAKRVSDLAEMNTASWAKQLRAVAFSDVGDLFGADGKLLSVAALPPHVRHAIASIKVNETREGRIVEYKFWNKNQALETVARHLGLFERDNAQLRPDVRVNVVLVG